MVAALFVSVALPDFSFCEKQGVCLRSLTLFGEITKISLFSFYRMICVYKVGQK